MTEENINEGGVPNPESTVLLEYKDSSPPMPVAKQSSVYKEVPIGSNPLAARDLATHFNEKLFYNVALEQTAKYDENLFDTWNRRNLFGKVDNQGVPIYPSETFLKLFPSTRGGKDIWGLNFVVDMFEEMAAQAFAYKNKAPTMFGAGSTPFFPLQVAKGWKSAANQYHEFMGSVYKLFTENYLERHRQEVIGFDSFANLFFKFVKEHSRSVVFTFSGFLLTAECSRRTTGLAIDLFDKKYDDDAYKFKEYFLDTNFEFYRFLTGTNGFAIDKNIPWRLYVNLDHPKAQSAFAKHFLTPAPYTTEKIYDTVFKRAFVQDVQLLRFHLASFYNNYINVFNVTEVPKLLGGPLSTFTEYCANKKATVTMEKIYLMPEKAFIDGMLDPNSTYYQKYGDRFWLKFYFEIKLAEYGVKLDPYERRTRLRDLMSYYDFSGFELALSKVVVDARYERRLHLFRNASLKKPGGIETAQEAAELGAVDADITTGVSTSTVGSYGGGGSGGY